MSMSPRLPIALLTGALSAGCAGDGTHGSLGAEKQVTPEYVRLERVQDLTYRQLTVEAGCLDRLRFSHVETASEVRLSVHVRRYDADGGDGEDVPACAISSSVTLARPLGERPVLDDLTGRPVEVR